MSGSAENQKKETNPQGTPTITMSVNHGEKPEKFSGLHFKRWQQNMLFYLTTLNLARFLTEEAPQIPDGVGNVQAVSALDAWKHSDFLCRNYVLNGLVDSLYNVYCVTKTTKELWDSLDNKNIKLKMSRPRNLWSLDF